MDTLVDVCVYQVVLGVFVQLFPAMTTETFLLSLLTAILLKLVLELVALVFAGIDSAGRLLPDDRTYRRPNARSRRLSTSACQMR